MLKLFLPKIKSRFFLILCAFLAILTLAGCVNEAETEKIGTLTQQQAKNDSQQANIPKYLQTLQQQPYVSQGSRKIKAVALTFDADMTPHMLDELKSGKVKSWYDQRIVQTLRSKHVPATIFMTGMWAETYPDVVKNLADDQNFEIENHSYDHAAFKVPCYGLGLTQNAQEDITKAQDAIQKITGNEPKFFRFPGGCFDDGALKLVHSSGLIPVQWDVVSGDAYLKDPKAVARQVLSQAQNGSIIVLHLHGGPNAPATAEALPAILEKLTAQGYSFMTLDALLRASFAQQP